MNLPSLDKFEEHVKPGGLLVINSSIIERKSTRDRYHRCLLRR